VEQDLTFLVYPKDTTEPRHIRFKLFTKVYYSTETYFYCYSHDTPMILWHKCQKKGKGRFRPISEYSDYEQFIQIKEDGHCSGCGKFIAPYKTLVTMKGLRELSGDIEREGGFY